MTRRHFHFALEIPAPTLLVWSVITNVARWPEWTESISRVKILSPGPLQIGSRVRIHQPRLPPAWWQVTDLNPDEGFTWVSCAPGVQVTARHMVEAITTGSRVALHVQYEGLLGRWLAWWMGELNDRYLVMEANGLKARCTELAARKAFETKRGSDRHEHV